MSGETPKTLLLVEDEAVVAMGEKAALEKRGYRVLLARSGEEAVEAAKAEPGPDLVLMDIDLGKGLSGPEAAERILAGRHLPILYLSSHAEPEVVERAERVGSYGFVAKSSPLALLDASIRMAFRLFEANEAVAQSEARLARAERVAKIGNWELRLAERRMLASAGARAIYGVEEEELVLAEAQAFPLPEYRPALDRALADLVAGTAPYELDFKIRRGRDGAVLDIHSLAEYDSCRRVVFGVIADVTEQARTREALREKSAELDLYFTSALDLLCIADTGGRFLRLNPEWEKVLGYGLAELEGRSFLELVHPEDLSATLAALAKLRDQEEILSFENRYRRKDGSYRWIEWRSRPLGETIYAVARDITDRKLAAQEVQALLAEKDLILKEVHHRVKNSLNTASSLLSLQAEAVEDPEAKAALMDAQGRLQSMGTLYDRLYRSAEFQGISAKEYLPALVDAIVANLPRRRAIEVESRIEDFSLDVKRAQALGIIVNELLTNVLKYAFEGRASGRVSVAAALSGGRARVVVSDDGKGMPEEVSFENSTGFGLTLVQALTEQLKGTIRIERGGGTKVVLEFPA